MEKKKKINKMTMEEVNSVLKRKELYNSRYYKHVEDRKKEIENTRSVCHYEKNSA